MRLYYRILSDKHRNYVSKEEIMLNGITHETKSNTVPIVGITNPILKGVPYDGDVYKPEWLDFGQAIPCWLEDRNKQYEYISFDNFSNKIMVFNGDVSYLIVEQENFELLEGLEEQDVFYTGRTLESLFKEYWDSMMVLEQYIKNKPYPNPEVFIFENISAKYLKMDKK